MSLVGSAIGAWAGKKAGDAEAKSARMGQDYQRGITEMGQEQFAPYREAGTQAVGTYQELLGGGPEDYFQRMMGGFETSPGYQFRLDEGKNQLEAGAAARGGLFSGAQQKALTSYGQNVASQEYQNYMSNYGGYMDRLGGMAQMGQQAVGTGLGQAQQGAGQMANLFTAEGTANANKYLTYGAMGREAIDQFYGGAGGGAGQMSGMAGGAGAGGAGAATGLMAMASDERLKENIEHVGESKSGIPIVEFNYIGKEGRYRGVLAQELLETHPEAVFEDKETGYYKVNYNNIDVKMEKLD